MVVWRTSHFRAIVLLSLLGLLAGCDQWLRPDGDPRRESNYMQGESWMVQRDPQKAVSSFERALEVNPQNYYAHERLADLHFNQNEFPDAYYHLQRYLKQSKDTNYVLVQRLNLAGLRLAQRYADQIGRAQFQNDVDLWKQRYLDSSNQVQTLTRQLAQTTAVLNAQAHLPAIQAPPPQPTPVVQAAPTTTLTGPGHTSAARDPKRTTDQAAPATAHLAEPTFHVGPATNAAPAATAGPRKHLVKPGETPALIAKHYHVSTAQLMAANPHLDAKRMRAGIELTIPGK